MAQPFPFQNIDMNQPQPDIFEKLEEINNNFNKLNENLLKKDLKTKEKFKELYIQINENNKNQQQNYVYLIVIVTSIISIYLTYFLNKYT
jgi:hypothetical protein